VVVYWCLFRFRPDHFWVICDFPELNSGHLFHFFRYQAGLNLPFILDRESIIQVLQMNILKASYHARVGEDRVRLEYRFFREYLQSLQKDPVFIAFLQQVYPLVFSCNLFAFDVDNARNEISSFLYAAHAGGKGSVRLPGCSWSQFLHNHGESATLRLKAKLQSWVLEVFEIARPKAEIFDCEWGDDGSLRRQGEFKASIVLLLHSSVPGESDYAIVVDLSLHNPGGIDLLPITGRDVILSIDVKRDDFSAGFKPQNELNFQVQSCSVLSETASEATSRIFESVDSDSIGGTSVVVCHAGSRSDKTEATSPVHRSVGNDNEGPRVKKTKREHNQQPLVRLNAMCASDPVNGALYDGMLENDMDSITEFANIIDQQDRLSNFLCPSLL
jgi:hypothetical protein